MFYKIDGPVYLLESNTFDSNIVYIDGGKNRVLIDSGTGMYTERLIQELSRIGASVDRITDVILTHSHIDHIGGVMYLLKKNPHLRTYLHRDEAEVINSGDMSPTLATTFGVDMPALSITDPLEEGMSLDLGDVRLDVYHTPGHSAGSVCLHEKTLKILFTGDTMFAGGSFGRVDLPTGDAAALVRSLERISTMDFEIAVPGHMNAVLFDGRGAAQLSYQIAKDMFNV